MNTSSSGSPSSSQGRSDPTRGDPLERALSASVYTLSEPHLSGWRVILGFETLEAAQDAQMHIAMAIR